MLTDVGLINHCRRGLMIRTKYMWGEFGRRITPATVNGKARQYPGRYSAARRRELLACADGKHYGCDCIGLIKSYLWGGWGKPKYCAATDYNVGTLLAASPHKGSCDNLPEIPGLALIIPGHVGVYAGHGEVIDCTLGNPFGDGVVKTRICDRKWLYWCVIPGIIYGGHCDIPQGHNGICV